MTPDEYAAAIYSIEAKVRGWSFLCDRACPAGDFFSHAERVIAALTERIDANFYGMEWPPIATNVEHLDRDAERIWAAWSPQKLNGKGQVQCPQARHPSL